MGIFVGNPNRYLEVDRRREAGVFVRVREEEKWGGEI